MNVNKSPLATFTQISPNRNSPRLYPLERISIHCVVGQCSVETLGYIFASPSKGASCTYGIGYDGRIGNYCPEDDRSWCTSSYDNDHRALTIEVASDTYEPYAVNDRAFASLLDLLTDICVRYKKKRLVWFGDRAKSLAYRPKSDELILTVHCWFENKSCPGTYLYERHGKIVSEVNARLAKKEMEEDYMDKRMILKELGDQEVAEYDNLPSWAQPAMRALLDTEKINGGTSAEVNPNDINMFLSDIKSIIVCKRIIDEQCEELRKENAALKKRVDTLEKALKPGA